MTSSIDGSLLRFSDHLNMVGRTDDARRRGKHGQHTKEARAERAEVPRFARELKAAIEVLDESVPPVVESQR